MSAASVGPSTRPPMATELYAAGRVIGNKCFDENLDFMKCKAAKGAEPIACASEGQTVHKCVYALFKDINSKAGAEFSAYAKCLDNSDLGVAQCKHVQAAFESAYYKS